MPKSMRTDTSLTGSENSDNGPDTPPAVASAPKSLFKHKSIFKSMTSTRPAPIAVEEPENSSPSEESKNSRVQSRSSSLDANEWTQPALVATPSLRERGTDLHQYFHLAEDEKLVNDYLCALRKRILLQGRMYVFERHLCFYSNIFGFVKVKTIPFTEITSIKKRKNYGFPNSIEISWQGGKREFFTSFLSRDEAYDLLLYVWHQASPYAKLFSGEPPRVPKAIRGSDHMSSKMSTASAPADLGHGRPESVTADLRNSFSVRSPSATGRVNSILPGRKSRAAINLADVPEDRSEVRGSTESLYTKPISPPAPMATPYAEAPREPSPLPPTPPSTGARRAARAEVQSADGGPSAGPSKGPGGPVDSSGSGGADGEYLRYPSVDEGPSDDESEEDGVADPLSVSPFPAPPPPEDMTVLLEETVNCSVREFVQRFLSDPSNFYADFHLAGGDKNVALSRWRAHPGGQGGKVRDLNFIANLRGKSALGPAEAFCNQTQWYCVYANDHLVFETRQVMPEIPYGESFAVEVRWDVTPVGGPSGSPRGDPADTTPFSAENAGPRGQCRVRVAVRIPFNKNIIWRKAIERSVKDQTAASMRSLFDMVHGHLKTVYDTQGDAGQEGAGGPVTHVPSAEELQAMIQRLPEEYRTDVARMFELKVSSQKSLTDTSSSPEQPTSRFPFRFAVPFFTTRLQALTAKSRPSIANMHQQFRDSTLTATTSVMQVAKRVHSDVLQPVAGAVVGAPWGALYGSLREQWPAVLMGLLFAIIALQIMVLLQGQRAPVATRPSHQSLLLQELIASLQTLRHESQHNTKMLLQLAKQLNVSLTH